MKKAFTICFMVTGGITVEAETEDEALEYFNSDEGQKEVYENLNENEIDITEVYEEEDWDFDDE